MEKIPFQTVWFCKWEKKLHVKSVLVQSTYTNTVRKLQFSKIAELFQYLAAMDTVWDNGSIAIDYLKKALQNWLLKFDQLM